MTAQFREQILIDGVAHMLCSEPLGAYIGFGGYMPPLDRTCTALWRGYLGKWEIRDGRLYLLALSAMPGCALTLEDVFPGYPDRVFAHWYSGTLRVAQGNLLRYVHQGYRSVYERDLFIRVEQGVVTGQETRENPVESPPDKVSVPGAQRGRFGRS